jgi:Uma2 family endonuclease
MLTVEKKKKYTAEDYMQLEEGAPFQLINHELIMSPSPIPFHQLISRRLIKAISDFLGDKIDDGFLVYAPMDVKLDDGNVLQPDILYVIPERKAQIVNECVEGAPDLVIEILSPSNAYYDLRQKKNIYEKYGVKEYIIIDPIEQSAELYSLKEGIYELYQKAQNNEQLNSVLLPGLSIELPKLFK